MLVRLALAVGVIAVAGACGQSPSPAGPGPNPSVVGFEGEWSGTTFQGLPISFTVSASQSVTRLTVGFRLDACAGTETSTDLVFGSALQSPPALIFAFRLNSSVQVSVQAYRMPDGSLTGPILFVVPPACGPSEAIAGSFSVRR